MPGLPDSRVTTCPKGSGRHHHLFRKRWWWRPLPLGQVVTLESGNPGIAGCDCHPISEDHLTLVKPPNRDADVYAGVLRFIRKALNESRSLAVAAPATKGDVVGLQEEVRLLR